MQLAYGLPVVSVPLKYRFMLASEETSTRTVFPSYDAETSPPVGQVSMSMSLTGVVVVMVSQVSRHEDRIWPESVAVVPPVMDAS